MVPWVELSVVWAQSWHRVGHLVGFWVGLGAEPGASRPGPGSQAKDYFYASVHGTWPRHNCAICPPLPLSSWQARGVIVEGLGEEGERSSFSGLVLAYPPFCQPQGLGCVGGLPGEARQLPGLGPWVVGLGEASR